MLRVVEFCVPEAYPAEEKEYVLRRYQQITKEHCTQEIAGETL
jgi:hypothetical protein